MNKKISVIGYDRGPFKERVLHYIVPQLKKKWRKVCFTNESHCRRLLSTILRGCFMAEEGVSSVLWQSVHLLNILPPTRLPKPTPLLLPRTQPASKNDESAEVCSSVTNTLREICPLWIRENGLFLCTESLCAFRSGALLKRKMDTDHSQTLNISEVQAGDIGRREEGVGGGGWGDGKWEKWRRIRQQNDMKPCPPNFNVAFITYSCDGATSVHVCVCTLRSSILPITSTLIAHDHERVGPYQ